MTPDVQNPRAVAQWISAREGKRLQERQEDLREAAAGRRGKQLCSEHTEQTV